MRTEREGGTQYSLGPTQLWLDDGFQCGCWRVKEADVVLAGYSCTDCLGRALAYLEQLLYLDKVLSVSGSESEAEE